MWARSLGPEWPDTDLRVTCATCETGEPQVWTFSNVSAVPHPVHAHAGQFRVLSRSGGRGQVFPWERGLKDTVLLMALETVDVAVRDVPQLEAPPRRQEQLLAAGYTDIGLYYPSDPTQLAAFERCGIDVAAERLQHPSSRRLKEPWKLHHAATDDDPLGREDQGQVRQRVAERKRLQFDGTGSIGTEVLSE